MSKRSTIIVGVVVCLLVMFLGYFLGHKYTGRDNSFNSLTVLKGETLSGKQLLEKIEDTSVDIEQKITDGVVINIDKSMLDTDMYEVVDVVNLGNNKIKLVVRNKTVTEDVAREVVYGDANLDGKVDEADLTLLKQYLAKWELNLNVNQLLAMDVNLDGKVDGKDQVILSKYLAHESGYDKLPYVK